MTRIQPEGAVFGERLRYLRKRRDLTQEDLARASDLTGPYISDMERGLKVPSLTTIIRLAVALDCRVVDLVSTLDKTGLRSLLQR